MENPYFALENLSSEDHGYDGNVIGRWVDAENTIHWYWVRDDSSLEWEDAKKRCKALGGHLATITSQGEQAFIVKLIQSCDKNGYWLGGTDAGTEGYWRWITDEDWVPQEYEDFWAAFEPNNSSAINGETEDCLMMYGKDMPESEMYEVGMWNDMKNKGATAEESPELILSEIGYVCEWEWPNS